jgi:site-specific DNA-methyltransferase (adenine-specific)
MISEAKLMHNMDWMNQFDDKYFDLLIADPPYFQGPNKRQFYGNSISTKSIKRKQYPINSNWEIPNKDFLKEVLRVSKHQIIFGINYMPFIHCSGRIIWDKVNGSSSYSDCEIASCSYHYSVRLFRFMWNGMMQGKSISEGHIPRGNKKLNQKRIHQCEKPIELYRWIYQTYLPLGGKVADPYLGSGSSRIAADVQENIDFYGCEIFEKSFIDQENRYKSFTAQTRLKFDFELNLL